MNKPIVGDGLRITFNFDPDSENAISRAGIFSTTANGATVDLINSEITYTVKYKSEFALWTGSLEGELDSAIFKLVNTKITANIQQYEVTGGAAGLIYRDGNPKVFYLENVVIHEVGTFQINQVGVFANLGGKNMITTLINL